MEKREHRLLKIGDEFYMQYRRWRFGLLPTPWESYVDVVFDMEMPFKNAGQAIAKCRDFLSAEEKIPIVDAIAVQ
jgi:hypothetical protein